MRPLALVALSLVGFFSAHAAAQVPDVPTVTLPTTIEVPSLPTVTSPVPLPDVDVDTEPVDSVLPGDSSDSSDSSGSSGSGGSTGSGSSDSSSGTEAGGGGGGDGDGRASTRGSRSGLGLTDFRARPSRFKNEPRGGRDTGTMLLFRLSRAAVVFFRVRQESPQCEREGGFRVSVGRGGNRVPFSGWLGGEPLSPGTYTISAQARRGSLESAVQRTTVVIVPADEDVGDARRAPSQCGQQASSSWSSRGSTRGASFAFGAAGTNEPANAGPSAKGGILGAKASLPDDETATTEALGGAPGEEPGSAAPGDGLLPDYPIESRPWLLLLAAILLLALLVAGNLAYGWRLRRGARA